MTTWASPTKNTATWTNGTKNSTTWAETTLTPKLWQFKIDDTYEMLLVDDSFSNVDNIKYQQDTDSNTYAGLQGGTGSSGENFQAIGQSFTTTSEFYITEMKLKLAKSGSPTDNLYVELVSGSIDGTVLETSSLVSGATLLNGQYNTFTFSGLTLLNTSTRYWIRLLRDGAIDTVNMYSWYFNTTDQLPSEVRYRRSNNSWGEEASTDYRFQILGYDSQDTGLNYKFLITDTETSAWDFISKS